MWLCSWCNCRSKSFEISLLKIPRHYFLNSLRISKSQFPTCIKYRFQYANTKIWPKIYKFIVNWRIMSYLFYIYFSNPWNILFFCFCIYFDKKCTPTYITKKKDKSSEMLFYDWILSVMPVWFTSFLARKCNPVV